VRLLPRAIAARLTPPRLLLVPGWLVFAFVALYLAAQWPVVFRSMLYGSNRPQEQWSAATEASDFHSKILCAVAVIYALVRAARFHPALRPAYKTWLEQSPWSAAQPLPLGPVQLVWRDAIPMAALALLAHFHAGLDPTIPLAFAVFVYLLVLSVILLKTGAIPFAVALISGLPVMAMLVEQPVWALIAGATLYGVAEAGLRRSLQAFPWREEEAPTGLPTRKALTGLPLGWPLDRIAPKPLAPSGSQLARWVGAVLFAWWVYTALHLARLPDDGEAASMLLRDLSIVSLLVGLMVGGLRALAYTFGHAPPISLAGRILTGRLIIPRYDYIFIAPLCVAVSGAAAMPLLHSLGVRLEAAFAASVALVSGLAFTMRPSFNTWRLTGAHRMVQLGEGTGGSASLTDE
jgi:hypothetical protein